MIKYDKTKWVDGTTVLRASHMEKIEKGITDIIDYNNSIYTDEDKRKENEIKREEEHNKRIQEVDTLVDDLKSDYDALEKIIIDENVSVNLQNQINNVNSQLAHNMSNIDILKTQHINILDYGADPKCVNDSYEAIQNAINDARIQGKIVYIPSGTYKLSQGLVCEEHNNHRGIVGAGMHNSVLKFEGEGTALMTRGASGIYQDFGIIGDRTKEQNGIDFYFYGGHGRTNSIFIDQMNGFGVKYTAVWDYNVDNLIIARCGNSQNYAFIVTGGTDTSNHTNFNRVQVELSYEKAIYIDPSTLSCVFTGIHSERTQIVDSSVVTHGLYGARCTFESARIQNSDGTHPYVGLGGENTTFNGYAISGKVNCHFGVKFKYYINNSIIIGDITTSGLGIPVFNSSELRGTLSIGTDSVVIDKCDINKYDGKYSLGDKSILNSKINDFSYSSVEHRNLKISNSTIANDLNFNGRCPDLINCNISNINCQYSNMIMKNCEIKGNLTIYGAGSYTRRIQNCYITGDVIRSSGGVVIAINNIVNGTDFTKLEPNDKIMKPSYL